MNITLVQQWTFEYCVAFAFNFDQLIQNRYGSLIHMSGNSRDICVTPNKSGAQHLKLCGYLIEILRAKKKNTSDKIRGDHTYLNFIFTITELGV